MPLLTKAELGAENAALRRRIAELERQLPPQPAAPGLQSGAEKLPAVEVLLRQVLESTLDTVFAVDGQYRLMINNQRHQEALVTSGGRALQPGESVLSPDFPPEVCDYWRAAYDRALSGETFQFETRWNGVDGQMRVFENNFAPLRDVSGAIAGVLVVVHDTTAYRRAEQALQRLNATLEQRVATRTQELAQSEDRFERVFLSSAAPQILSVLADGRILEINDACCRLLGYERSELVGRTSLEANLWEPSERQALVDALEKPGGLVNYEINARTRSGEVRRLLLSSEPLELRGIPCLLSTGLDITAHQRMQQALAESNYKLETLFNLLPIGISVLDASGQVVKENPALESILNLSAEKLARGDYLQRSYIQLDGSPLPLSEFPSTRVLRGEESVHNVEVGVVKEDQRVAWLHVSAAAAPFADWKVVIATRDITDRVQAEGRLRESEARFAAFFEHSPVAMGIMRMRDSRYTHANAAMVNLFGYSRAELVGRTSQEMGLWADPLERQRCLERLQTDGYVSAFEALNRHRSGRLMNVLVSSQIVTLDQEQYLLGQIMDISERKRAEATLQKALGELEQANRQLQDLSRRLLEAQEQERRAIGRELHDEIGQALTGLKLLLEMAQRPPLEVERGKVKTAQEVADQLIERVSALSLNLRPPMLDDLGLLPALLWFIDRYTAQTGLRVDFRHRGLRGKRFPAVLETAVYRLAQESLTNVARHARAAQAVLAIRAGRSSLDLSIEDGGAGFDAAAALAGNASGGLSGMRERVRLLQGELEIDSVPGQGTRVSIRLPLPQKEEKQA